METYRPDRVVKVLTTLVSIAYFGFGILGPLVLIAAPLVKLLTDGDPDWIWGLRVPASVPEAQATVLTTWGPARLEVEDVHGVLRLPLSMLPWWLVAVLWAHVAVVFALIMLFLHQLRRIFQRVRAGAPFDAANARRLRWLGLLLIAVAVVNGVAEQVASGAVRVGMASGAITVQRGLHLDLSAILVALVLVALAEIFRRGAELEDEQSLVV